MTTIERPQTPAAAPASDAEIGFVPEGMSVDVRAKTEKLWELLATFEYRGARDRYVVTASEITDFASVPRVFVWFIPSYGLYTKAAILHDVLCRLADEGKFSRRDADGIFRQAMRILGVAFLRRWVMWVAVRWGALMTSAGRKDWLKDAWIVLPITVLLMPLLLPPAALIFVALVIWYVLEMLAWVPLHLARRAKGPHQPAKKVNWPELTFKA
jgi:hypothetical protein